MVSEISETVLLAVGDHAEHNHVAFVGITLNNVRIPGSVTGRGGMRRPIAFPASFARG